MNEICALIVTYNRCDLLKECIDAVKSQSHQCDLLVIDNDSSDGTEEFLKTSNIPYERMENNIGGAGGFNYGIRRIVELGYRYVWLMDDDCIPEIDALEKLFDASNYLKGEFGFLASRVLWTDRSLHKMNEIHVKEKDRLKDNIYITEQATFVSLLLRTDVIKHVGFPIKDFFIWGDDIEFTRRITKRNGISSYYISDSNVIHKTKNNIGSKIAFDDIKNIGRYRYAYRNEAYLYRQEGFKGIVYYILKCLYNLMRILLLAKDHKIKRIRCLFNGISEGIAFDPKVEFFDE